MEKQKPFVRSSSFVNPQLPTEGNCGPPARLEQAGKPIGGNDVLIAAQAVALGYAVATDNERDFARIPGLASENWLRES
ncbi:MAG TPA: hypothetical protein VMU45_08465 [Candidatus Eisenbacteria bacterium]|nr:hypothetical protein [Candidatus Eisenbacteria bacterium]